MIDTNSSWELTRQRSNYHFDNFRLDPEVDTVTYLGNIAPFWQSELEDIIKLAQPKTWRTRGQGADRPAEEYDQEDYDLEQFGYGKDHIVSDLTWDVPETFEKIKIWFGMANCKMRLHVQRPGQIWNLHLDKLQKWCPEDPSRVIRIFIQLTDWQPGQFWEFGNHHWNQWRAGDVFSFDWADIPHCTANAGMHPRVTFQLTGIVTPQTRRYLESLR